MASWRSMTKIAGSGSISQRHGSADGSTRKFYGSGILASRTCSCRWARVRSISWVSPCSRGHGSSGYSCTGSVSEYQQKTWNSLCIKGRLRTYNYCILRSWVPVLLKLHINRLAFGWWNVTYPPHPFCRKRAKQRLVVGIREKLTIIWSCVCISWLPSDKGDMSVWGTYIRITGCWPPLPPLKAKRRQEEIIETLGKASDIWDAKPYQLNVKQRSCADVYSPISESVELTQWALYQSFIWG